MGLFLQYILVALLFGLSDGQDTNCCVSKKFYGQVRSINTLLKKGSSVLKITENRFELDYDYDMKMDRESGTVFTDDGGIKSTYTYDIINDYTHLKSYYLFNNSGSCSVDKISIEHRIRHCVPSSLQLVGSYIIGSGPEAILVNDWEGINKNYTQSMQTSSYDCTPVSSVMYGVSPEGDTVSQTYLYGNYTQYRVSSPNVFKIPVSCISTEPVVGK